MIYVETHDKDEIKKIKKSISKLNTDCKIYYDYLIQNEKEKQKLKANAKIVVCNENSNYINSKDQIILIPKKHNYEDDLEYYIDDYSKKSIIKPVVSILLLIFLVIAVIYGRNQFGSIKVTPSKKNNKIEEKQNYKYDNIVFLGDSITDYYDLDKYYKNIPTVNSGTAGYRTDQTLDEIDSRVTQYNPTKVFILIGTNDITMEEYSNKEIAENIIKIADKIHEKRKMAKIYIESIYPVNRDFDNEKVSRVLVNIRQNSQIMEINNYVKDMLKDKDYKYLDMYDLLKDKNGDMNLDYSVDGLHLNDNGYKVITKEIIKYINDKNK